MTTIKQAEARIATRTPFTASALKGIIPETTYLARHDLGQLPQMHAEVLLADAASGRVDFIVYSYQTPIAWHSKDTGWEVPDHRYSVTTTRHQNVVRRAVA